jgi:tetratricopeptide (TPR) repeat protein
VVRRNEGSGEADLADIRVVAIQGEVTWSASGLSIDKRKELLLAIRARLLEGVQIEEWKGQQLATFVPGAVVGAAGVALLVASSFLGNAPYNALGIRCSVSSQYLRDRFDLPNDRGCVVLRVSGPAERAGVEQGDLMIEMDGVPIVSGGQFSYLLEDSPDDAFRFKFLRSRRREPVEIRVEMGPTKGPEEDDKDPLFYYLRARSDTERRRVPRDFSDYSRAIELAPSFDLAYMFRGALYQDEGKPESARADYEKAIELSPDLGTAHRWLATLEQEEGDREAAMRGFDRGITLDECAGGFTRYNIDCAEGYLLLAGFYMGTDIEKVRAAAERSVEFYPGFAEPYYQLAVFHHFMDEDDAAQGYAEKYFAFPEGDREVENDASLRALLSESSFNCDGALEDAPRWRCPISLETSGP